MEDDAPLFVPFTELEHKSFLSALEKIGPTGDLTGIEWGALATAAGRTEEDVRAHAYRYMLLLQAEAPRPLLNAALPNTGHAWTAAEDAALEAAIGAGNSPAGIPELQHRSPSEVAARYEALLSDLLKIELGETVVVTRASTSAAAAR